MSANLSRVVDVPIAEARLRVRGWPPAVTTSILRGAVCAELEQHAAGGLHVDWHSHAADGTTRQAPALTSYRIHDGVPSVHWHGPRAHEHAALLARCLHALRLPGGDVVEVEGVELTTAVERAAVTGRRPNVYRLVTPIWAPVNAWARKPSERGSAAERAWASFLVAGCIREWLRSVGVDLADSFPVDVHLEDLRWRPTRWRDARSVGPVATVYTTATLPDGIGLGQHRTYGFGEIRRVGKAWWR